MANETSFATVVLVFFTLFISILGNKLFENKNSKTKSGKKFLKMNFIITIDIII